MITSDQREVLKTWQAQLPFHLIKYDCHRCKQHGWIPDWIGAFKCKHCHQPLRLVVSVTPRKSLKGMDIGAKPV